MRVCRIAVKPNGEHWGANWNGGGVECGRPATRCIVGRDDSGYTNTLWLCEAHWNDPHVRQFFDDVWDTLEY